jgi:hypothetical protein
MNVTDVRMYKQQNSGCAIGDVFDLCKIKENEFFV